MSFAAMAAAANANMLAPFGETAVIADGTPAGKSVTGVFDGPFERVVIGVGVESYAPRLTVRAADLAGIAGFGHGTALTVAGKSYTVAGIQPERPDGQGLTVLILTEA